MIRLGSLAGYSFEGPYTLAGWNPIDSPGVYAIMYKQEQGGKDHYAVIYVGHTDNFTQEGSPLKPPPSPAWAKRPASRGNPYLASFSPPAAPTPPIRPATPPDLNPSSEPTATK